MSTTFEETALDPALNLARQSLYRFTALALLDPRAGTWEQMCQLRYAPLLQEAAALVRAEPSARAASLGVGERPLDGLDPSLTFERLCDSATDLNTAYERAFGLLVSSACPPYETEYINGKFSFQRSNALSDVSGFYRAFGLVPSSAHPERHDHIVLELEFMAYLLGLERRALEDGISDAEEKAHVCRGAQQRFFKEHVAWWMPAFAHLLARENRGGFYEAVANFLAALVPAERALLGVAVQAGLERPSSLEPPEECEGCSSEAI